MAETRLDEEEILSLSRRHASNHYKQKLENKIQTDLSHHHDRNDPTHSPTTLPPRAAKKSSGKQPGS